MKPCFVIKIAKYIIRHISMDKNICRFKHF